MADSTVFSYGITLSGDGAVRLFPAAKVNFLNHKGEWFTLFLVVDSGANISALPKRDARTLGIAVEEGTPTIVVSIGAETRGWQHTVDIRLKDEVLTIPLLFLDDDDAPRILGRAGIFERFTILFEETKRRTGFLGTGSQQAQTTQGLLDELSPLSVARAHAL
jgi:hypothetical protein